MRSMHWRALTMQGTCSIRVPMPEPSSRRRKRPAAVVAAGSQRGLPHELMQQIATARGDPDFMTSLERGLVVLRAANKTTAPPPGALNAADAES